MEKALRGRPTQAQQALFHTAQRPKPAVPGAGGWQGGWGAAAARLLCLWWPYGMVQNSYMSLETTW